MRSSALPSLIFFFFNDTATTEIYTLSLHDALPISRCAAAPPPRGGLVGHSRRGVRGRAVLRTARRVRPGGGRGARRLAGRLGRSLPRPHPRRSVRPELPTGAALRPHPDARRAGTSPPARGGVAARARAARARRDPPRYGARVPAPLDQPRRAEPSLCALHHGELRARGARRRPAGRAQPVFLPVAVPGEARRAAARSVVAAPARAAPRPPSPDQSRPVSRLAERAARPRRVAGAVRELAARDRGEPMKRLPALRHDVRRAAPS